jgi:hypothetical protein
VVVAPAAQRVEQLALQVGRLGPQVVRPLAQPELQQAPLALPRERRAARQVQPVMPPAVR